MADVVKLADQLRARADAYVDLEYLDDHERAACEAARRVDREAAGLLDECERVFEDGWLSSGGQAVIDGHQVGVLLARLRGEREETK